MAAPPAVPLLRTKLYLPPPRAERVPRPGLARRLDQALRRCPVTLISAPAGFGKSALAAEWRASRGARGARLAWLALDAADNDSARFVAYLTAAFATLDAGIGHPAEALLAEGGEPDARVVVASLLSEAEARLPSAAQPWVLALDDYQEITAPAVHAAVTLLADRLPPGMRLALFTRADPPLPLARWRVQGRLAELRAEALRFTPAETRRFLNEVMRLGLPAREVARLEAQTEGWAAALQLAALALKRGAAPGFGARHAYLVDYLAGEVTSGLPAETRRFLQAAALPDRLCAPLCAAMLDGDADEAQARLEQLERQNLFLIPLDDERRWYRFHHLFAEHLRGLWGQAQTAERRALHRRAGAWLEAHGCLEEAVEQWVQAEDDTRLEAVLPRAANALLRMGGNQTVRRWVQALPAQAFEHSPRLALTAAWVEALRRPAAEGVVEGYLALARRDGSAAVTREAALIEAELALGYGDLPRALERAQQAYHLLEDGAPSLRALAALDVAVAHWWLGRWRQADEALTQAAAASSAADHPAIHTRILALLVPMRLAQGRLRAAASAGLAALAARPPQALTQLARQANLALAEAHLEWNALEAAAPHVAAVAVAVPILGPAWQALAQREAQLLAARLRAAAGDAAGAREALALARPGRRHVSGAWAQRLAAREARLWLELGDRRAALRAYAGSPDDVPPFAAEFEAYTLARLQLAHGQAEAALAGLRTRLPAARAEGRMGHAAENLALQALAEQALGRAARAVERLGHALRLAEPGGYTRLFIAPGPTLLGPMSEVLARAAERPTPQAVYARRLLAAAEAEAPGLPAERPAEPLRAAPLPLTQGERRVMVLMAAGLTNDEIGRQLGISLNTVRTHNKSIFRKLDVRSRTQAAARARDAGLA